MGGITGDVVRGKFWVVNASISHCRAGGHTRKWYFLPTSPNPDVVVFFFAPSHGPPVVKKGKSGMESSETVKQLLTDGPTTWGFC